MMEIAETVLLEALQKLDERLNPDPEHREFHFAVAAVWRVDDPMLRMQAVSNVTPPSRLAALLEAWIDSLGERVVLLPPEERPIP